ncbi:metallophosphoesterase [Paenibacillus sp. CC-CFT747]|nr:metallophosphoesterase [Paenibacillus sp. CC-CFT747]
MADSRLTRRTFLRKSLFAAGALPMLLGAGGLYGVFGERYWIQIQKIKLAPGRLPAAFHGMRVVQFSDTHLGKYYSVNRLAHMAELVQRQKPDLICFTGDLFDSQYGRVNPGIIPILSRLKAELGKFAVLGNHDMRLGADSVRDVLEKADFTVLVNGNRPVGKGGERFRVAGVDEMIYGQPDLKKALIGAKQEEFVLLLCHEPDFADTAMKFSVDLQLSGHSHGGQIRIPGIGSLFTPELGQKYSIGLYSFEEKGFHVYTNRGIGTTLFPIRLHCRPEITVFEWGEVR